jgi:hypothetical protein
MDKCLVVMQPDAELQYCKLYNDAISTERAVEYTVQLEYMKFMNVIVLYICAFKRRFLSYVTFVTPNSEGSCNL